jgi:hypothetical protein
MALSIIIKAKGDKMNRSGKARKSQKFAMTKQ